MSDDDDNLAAQRRRRRLREALDAYAPDPLTVSDEGHEAMPNGATKEPSTSGGLSEEDLKREVPPHHGG